MGDDLRHIDAHGDGLTDEDETTLFGTDPLVADTDADGYSDAAAVFDHGTDPFDPESRPNH